MAKQHATPRPFPASRRWRRTYCCRSVHPGPRQLRYSLPIKPEMPVLATSSCVLLLPSGSLVFRASHLFQLVEQSFVTDLQVLGCPAPVPAGSREGSQNDFFLSLAGCGTSYLF